MTERPLSARDFGAAFKGFLEEATTGAPAEETVFAQRLRAHLDADPVGLAVVGQEFQPTDRPNVQAALDALLKGRDVEKLGFTAPFVGMEGPSFTTLLAHATRGMGPPAAQAPVRYVSVELGDGEVLACLDSTLLLLEGPLAVVVASSPRNGPFGGTILVQAMAPDRADADAFLAGLRHEVHERNVYRGRIVSLEQDHRGLSIRFHRLPGRPRRHRAAGWGARAGRAADGRPLAARRPARGGGTPPAPRSAPARGPAPARR